MKNNFESSASLNGNCILDLPSKIKNFFEKLNLADKENKNFKISNFKSEFGEKCFRVKIFDKKGILELVYEFDSKCNLIKFFDPKCPLENLEIRTRKKAGEIAAQGLDGVLFRQEEKRV